MISKSNGVSLLSHSRAVEKLSKELCKKLLLEDVYVRHAEMIETACLIHDIGKCINGFQIWVKSKMDGNICEEEWEPISVHHHEVSWAISVCLFEDKQIYEYMLNAIYWHHAKPRDSDFENKNISSILNKISDEEISLIYNNLAKLITRKIISFEEFKENVENYKQSSKETPKYFIENTDKFGQNKINKLCLLYRSILLSSDRIISKLPNEEIEKVLFIDGYCNNLIENNKGELNYSIPEEYEKNRIDRQIQIAKECNDSKTSIIKAPAGFGKTLVGLLWSIKRKNKLLWVCPRNIVVESVYDSILKEIDALGLSEKISSELFITGTRQNCTNKNIEEFQSDIVVTNIDNFLGPISKNRFGEWAIEILKRDVVFDEFHEFVSDNALFSGFIEIMNVRHNMTNCNTVLLSATPNLFNFLWDNDYNNKTKILPNLETHYPAAHLKPYKVNFIKENDLKNQRNSLIVTNSIHNAQLIKKRLDIELLIHSAFLPKDRENNFNILLKNYKKNSVYIDKPSTVSSPILQASMEISFYDINKSLCGPESDIQVVGRCNRWGEYNGSTLNYFEIDSEKKSENSAIGIQYDMHLHELWVAFFKKEVEKYNFFLNLNELYVIYNKFYKEHEDEIKEFILNKYKLSLRYLSKIEPIKYGSKSEERSNMFIAIPSMRTNSNSIFVTYMRNDMEKEFVEPFSVDIPLGVQKTKYFHEDNVVGDYNDFVRKFETNIKYLAENKIFDYPKNYKKNVNPETVFKYAFRERTPYLAFDKKYSEEYGLAKVSIYL
jgi:CRISPR-associated endonuclease/helicase Cas3